MSEQSEAAPRQHLAERAAAALFARDRASQALGMRLEGVQPGSARVLMSVRAEW